VINLFKIVIKILKMTSQQAMSETASQATAQSTASQVNIKLETN
jgi:hypothetical protein